MKTASPKAVKDHTQTAFPLALRQQPGLLSGRGNRPVCGDLLADFLSRCPRQQTIAPFDRESLTCHCPAWFKAIINNSHPAGNG